MVGFSQHYFNLEAFVMSGLLDAGMCVKAVDMAMPSIDALMKNGTFRQPQMCIVVGNPLIPAGSMPRHEFTSNGILYERALGNKKQWKNGYDVFAKEKAYLSWKHRMTTQQIQTLCPHLLERGDILYYGSAFYDGIVVAASGVDPFHDEMVSWWVLAAIRALCISSRSNIDPNSAYGAFLK